VCPFERNNFFLGHFRVSLTIPEILSCNRVTGTSCIQKICFFLWNYSTPHRRRMARGSWLRLTLYAVILAFTRMLIIIPILSIYLLVSLILARMGKLYIDSVFKKDIVIVQSWTQRLLHRSVMSLFLIYYMKLISLFKIWKK